MNPTHITQAAEEKLSESLFRLEDDPIEIARKVVAALDLRA